MTEQEMRTKVVERLKYEISRADISTFRQEWIDCVEVTLLEDALALLKAQGPVEPKIVDTSNSKLYHNDMFKNYYCGNCGEFLHVVNRKDMFCSQCGRMVKWE